MLDKQSIQKAIIDRMDAMDQSCNSFHLNHNVGVLRGLVWAIAGEDPEATTFGQYNPNAVADCLRLAEIPFRMEGERIVWWYPWEPEPPAGF